MTNKSDGDLARYELKWNYLSIVTSIYLYIYIYIYKRCLCLYHNSGRTCGWISLKLGVMIGFDPT